MSAPIETGGPIPLGDDGVDVFEAHAEREDLQRKEARYERLLADLEKFEQEEAAQAAESAEAAPSEVSGAPTAPGEERTGLAVGAGQETGETTPGAMDRAKKAAGVAGSIAHSLVPYPSQVVGGMLDFIPNAVEGIRAAGEWVTSWMPQVGVVIGGDDLISIKSGDAYRDVALGNRISDAVEAVIPDIAEREGGGGEMARAMAQFLTGFMLAGTLKGIKALGAIGRAGQITSAAIRGAIADFSAFDAHEARLSDLIEQFPALQNPVSEYLASDPEDLEMEGRFKNAIEGLGLGVLAEGLFAGVRAIAKARKARAALEPVEAVTGELEQMEGMVDIQRTALHDLLGDSEKPMFDVTPLEVSDAEAARILAEGGDAAAERAAAAVPRGTKGEAGSEIMVNWARIDTPDDVKALIQDVANLRSDSVDAARRGKMTFEEIQLGAQEVDAFDALMKRGTNTGLSAEETFAVRELWGRSGRKLKELVDLVNADPSDSNKIAFRKMLGVHSVIQDQVIAARTETARALAVWRIPAGDTIEFAVQMDNLKQLIGDHGTTEELASRIGKLYDRGDLVTADAMIYGSNWVKTKDAVAQLWYFSLLSGPHTHMRNLISNTSVLPLAVLERRVAAFISQTGGSGEIFPEEAGAAFFGIFQGLRDAFRISAHGRRLLSEGLEQPAFAGQKIAENADEFGGFWRSLATGDSGYGIGKVEARMMGGFSPEKWQAARESPIAAVLSMVDTATSTTTRSLVAGDEIFKSANKRMELNALAVRKAMAEIKAGTLSKDDYLDRVTTLVNEPDESMRLMGNRAAQEFTFTNSLPPNSTIARWLRSTNRVPVLGKIVMPFVNTSYNLGRFAFQRSPVALGMQSYRDAINQGGAAADMARAKMLTGSAILAVMADLALQGRLTGEGPANPRERKQLRRMGWQPNSYAMGELKQVGNHLVAERYFSIRGLEPLATSAGIAANTVEILAAAGDDDDTRLGELVLATTLAIANQATTANYMYGFSLWLEAMSDPTLKGKYFFNKLAGAVVPTGIATVTRFEDPVMREVETMIDAMRARTPGLSDTLPAKHDLHGRPITRESGLGSAYDLLSPLYSSKWDPEPIDEELTKQEAYIGNPARAMSFGTVEIDLRDYPGAYQDYVKMAGNGITADEYGVPIVAGPFFSDGGTRLQELNSLVSGTHQMSSIYDDLSNGPYGGKVLLIKEIISAYQQEAKKRLLHDYPEIRTEINQKRFDKPGKWDFGIDEQQMEGFQ